MEVKNLKAGDYTVVWTNADHETLTAEITVSSSGVTCLGPCPTGVNIAGVFAVFGTLKPIVVPPPAKGYLSVSSEPSGASVDVNGTDIGKTPVSRHELSTGSKLVTLRLSGYKPEEKGVTIIDGETADLFVPLSAISPEEEGFLSITSTPSGASVSIAGVSIGSTPISSYGLPAGAKTVTISLSGYDTKTQDVVITAGETSTVDVVLEEAVVPTTICGWVDEVEVTALTENHWMYVYTLSMGSILLSDEYYAALSPKASRLPASLATEDNWVGLYTYTEGGMELGNSLTKCNY